MTISDDTKQDDIAWVVGYFQANYGVTVHIKGKGSELTYTGEQGSSATIAERRGAWREAVVGMVMRAHQVFAPFTMEMPLQLSGIGVRFSSQLFACGDVL